MSKGEKLALAALDLVIAIELAFLTIATASFFVKKNALTKYLLWKGSWIWVPLGLFFICIQLLMLVQSIFIVKGRRPPLFRKSDWALSEIRPRRRWLMYAWNSAIMTAGMLISNFSINTGKWGIIPLIAIALLVVGSFVLRKTGGRKINELPREDLTQE